MPATVTLTFHCPSGFEGMSHEEFAGTLRNRVGAVESDAEAKRWATGAHVMGRQATDTARCYFRTQRKSGIRTAGLQKYLRIGRADTAQVDQSLEG
jgi:hypothetical protein